MQPRWQGTVGKAPEILRFVYCKISTYFYFLSLQTRQNYLNVRGPSTSLHPSLHFHNFKLTDKKQQTNEITGSREMQRHDEMLLELV
jgi:hypothetical protein